MVTINAIDTSIVIVIVVRAVVRKILWLNGFAYDIRKSTDIVNTKVFNTPFCKSYCRHDPPLISALIVEVERVQSISEEPYPPFPPAFTL